MATDVLIRVKVDDHELDEFQGKVESTGGSIDRIEDSSKKASGEVKKGFTESSKFVEVLDQKTNGLASSLVEVQNTAKETGASFKGAFAAGILSAVAIGVSIIGEKWLEATEYIRDAEKFLNLQKDTIDATIGSLNSELELLDSQEDLLKIQGNDTAHIKEQRLEIIDALIKENKLLLENALTQLEIVKNTEAELTFFQKIIALRDQVGTTRQAFLAQAESERQQRISEAQQTVNEIEARLNTLETKAISVRTGSDTVTSGATNGGRDKINGIGGELQQQIDARRAVDDALLKIAQDGTDALREEQNKRIEDQLLTLEEEERIRQNRLESERSQAELLIETRQFQEESIYNVAANFASLFNQLGEESKELAIASIVIEQITSAATAIQSLVAANAKAVALFPITAGQPWVAINTASTIAGIAAGGIAASKAISQLGGGGGASSPNVPQSAGVAAPSFNLVGDPGINQVLETLSSEQQPIQAYITQGEVSSANEAERQRIDSATIV